MRAGKCETLPAYWRKLLGWNLSLPSITRKTDKGLPKYRDTEESDVFVLSGTEDLVPVLVEANGQWQCNPVVRTVDDVQYSIQHYRPRIEGLFARIERWTNIGSGETHWRSISKDNVTTLYGRTAESRIADPADRLRVFSWLICESYDDKGNAILYEYVPEDSAGIDSSQAHERNRTSESRSSGWRWFGAKEINKVVLGPACSVRSSGNPLGDLPLRRSPGPCETMYLVRQIEGWVEIGTSDR